MEALWSLVESFSAQLSWLLDLCPVQFLPSATQVIEVAGSKYRIEKQVCGGDLGTIDQAGFGFQQADDQPPW